MSFTNKAFQKEPLAIQLTSFSTSTEAGLPENGARDESTNLSRTLASVAESRASRRSQRSMSDKHRPSTNSALSERISQAESRASRRSQRSMSDKDRLSINSAPSERISQNGNTYEEPEVVDEKGLPEVATATPNSQPHEAWFYLHIAFFAMFGCLARIGSDRIFGQLAGIENPGEIVNQSFFSNIFGSFVLGALNGSPMGKTRLAALYKGLTTGFCGSFTTWSKWNQQLSLTLIGETPTPSQTQVLSIASWFIGFYTFIGSYCVGMDFGKDVGKLLGKHVHKKGHIISNVCVTVLLLLATAGFIVGVVLDTQEDGKSIWLAALFAPFGACLRAWLSQFKIERFKLPLGTLIANCLGAIVLAGLHVIGTRAVYPPCKSPWDICWPTVVIYGVGTGFCACLTTISTFMSEVYKLRPEHPRFAYSYVLITVIVCQVLSGIINGINFNYDTY